LNPAWPLAGCATSPHPFGELAFLLEAGAAIEATAAKLPYLKGY